jgi:hypothetical protein
MWIYYICKYVFVTCIILMVTILAITAVHFIADVISHYTIMAGEIK